MSQTSYTEIVVYSLLNLIPYLVVALTMFRDDLRFPFRYTLVYLVLPLCVLQIGIGLCATLYLRPYTNLISLFSYIIYLAFYVLAVRTSAGKLTFALFMVANYANLVVTLAKCLEYQIFPDLAMQGYRWTYSLTTILIQVIVLPGLFHLIRNQIRPILNTPDTQRLWRYLWLIPATFYGVWYYATYASKRSSLEFATLPSSALFMCVISGGFILVYYIVARMLQESAARAALEEENHLLTMQSVQQAHIKERIEEARRDRHDARQHYAILSSYLESGDTDGLRAYIGQLLQNKPADSAIAYCLNLTVNAVAVYYLDRAQSLGVRQNVRLELPEELPFAPGDLTVLFGNLLENACDALARQTEGEKTLSFVASYQNNTLLAAIDNSYNGTIRRRGEAFLSAKRPGDGIGLHSAGQIACKYGGELRAEHDGHTFRVNVLLLAPKEG